MGKKINGVLDKMFQVLETIFPDIDGTEIPKFTVACINGVATIKVGWDISLTGLAGLPFIVKVRDAGEYVELSVD